MKKPVIPAAEAPARRPRASRVQLTLHVDFGSREELRGAMLGDIAEGGIFVGTEQPLPVGLRIALLISFPGLPAPLRLRGEVRSTTLGVRNADEPGIGIAFTDVPPEAAAALGRVASHSGLHRSAKKEEEKRPPRIVVLESNPVLRDLLQYAFQSVVGRKVLPDLQAEFTSSVDECRAHLENGMSLAIVDLDSIGAGLDFVAQLRKGRFYGLPVLAVTSGLAPAADELTMVLRKPLALEQLLKTTELLLATAARRSG